MSSRKFAFTKLTTLTLLALLGTATVGAHATEYTIDPNHTFPSLEFSHMGLSIWRGKFDKTSGTAKLDRAAHRGSVDIVIDSSSINFGHDKMKEFALGEDWLNVQKFPTMHYQGTLRFKGDTAVAVDGALTLLGVTKPVTLTLNSFKCIDHPYFKKEVCGGDAEADLNRADFGMSKYSEGEAGKIHLRIQVEAIANDSAAAPK